MGVKVLIEHLLEVLSLKGGCTCSSESIHVKMPHCWKSHVTAPGLENSTRPLVFTSASGCRASENFGISIENYLFPIYSNNICDTGQAPILRFFEAWANIFCVNQLSRVSLTCPVRGVLISGILWTF